MKKSKEKAGRLNNAEINQINRFISQINRQDVANGVTILSNEKFAIRSDLLHSAPDLTYADIDMANGIVLSGRQLHDIVRNKIKEGLTIRTRQGELVRIYQEMSDVRNDVGAILNCSSSIPAPA